MKGSSPPGRLWFPSLALLPQLPTAGWRGMSLGGGGGKHCRGVTVQLQSEASRVRPSETRASGPDRHLPNLTR